MKTDKQERHQHGHEHRAHHEEPASTDIADVIREQQAANAASAHQRRHAGAKPADERFGNAAKADVHARLLKVDVSGGRTRITIGAGQEQGVRLGMAGYIKAGEGMLAEFQIESVEPASSCASVDLAPEAVYGSGEVVVNPASKPAAGKDIKGRIVADSIEGEFVKLTIALGATSGVRRGMKGFMHAADSDRPFADFVVGEVTARVSFAHVKLHNLDEVKRNPQVVINPTSATQAAQSHAGKPHRA